MKNTNVDGTSAGSTTEVSGHDDGGVTFTGPGTVNVGGATVATVETPGAAAKVASDPAMAAPGRYVAEVLCPTLPQPVRRALGQLTVYIGMDDLGALGLIAVEHRPTEDELNDWCQRNLRVPYDSYAKTLASDALRGIVTGYDPTRQVALATLVDAAEVSKEYAVLAVKRLRDRNTVARAEGVRRSPLALTLTVAELLRLGASVADTRDLTTATESLSATSVRIIEGWNEADRLESRRPAPLGTSMVLNKASKVARRHADWLWTTEQVDPHTCGVQAAMIPLHGLTTIAGREQAAKSTLCWWLAAQITHGLLPGHYQGHPRDVVILASEDSETKIRRRLEAAGADLDRVYLPSKTTPDDLILPISIRDDLDALTELLTGIEPGAVIFDPIKDFLGSGVNTDREDEVRPVLTPLLKLTEECGTAAIGLHHLNKSLKGDFLTRLTGSGAFKNVSRSVIGVAHDPISDTRLVQLMKSNDGELVRSAFQARVIGVDITIEDRTEKVGKWVMQGASLSDLDTVLASKEHGGRGGTAGERAKNALRTYLGRGGAEKPSEEVKQAVTEQLAVSEDTVKRAFRDMGGKHRRTTETPSRTLWWLPKDDEDDGEDTGDERG